MSARKIATSRTTRTHPWFVRPRKALFPWSSRAPDHSMHQASQAREHLNLSLTDLVRHV
jgi:hypothetical protein